MSLSPPNHKRGHRGEGDVRLAAVIVGLMRLGRSRVLLAAPLVFVGSPVAAQGVAAIQNSGVNVRIRGIAEMAKQPATVIANDRGYPTQFNDSAVASVVVQVPPRSVLSISIRAVGFKQWGTSVKLNGSEHVDWQLTPEGSSGSFDQWPYLEWASTGDTLQAVLDGQSIGKTLKGKGVAPDRPHALGWRRVGDEKAVCSKTVTLQRNEERGYVCDPATGTVTAR